METSASTLTLQDIADLARVRRPVVSMWRRRDRVHGEHVPFPAAVYSRGRIEHFDKDTVVAWVDRTGRGNNRDFKLDAVAAAVPDRATLQELVTLLCLRAVSDTDLAGLGEGELIDLADEADPDDTLFLSEVEAMAARAADLTPYVDELFAVTFGPADALDRMESGRLRRETVKPEFGPVGVRVLGTVTAALATHAGGESSGLIDASAGRSPLAPRIAAAWPEGLCGVFGVDGDSPDARRQRRTASLRGLDVRPRPEGPAVVVLPITGMPAEVAIRAIDELQLSLPPDRVAVVVGPASLLCDVPHDPQVEADRDSIVRTGTLRFAARLPRGLWSAAPRQALGLWVFGAQTAQRIEDRAIALADLSHAELTEAAIDDLATDAVAALGEFRARAFSFARVVPTSRVIAAREVVPPGAHSLRHASPSPAERLVRIDALSGVLAAELPVPEATAHAASGGGSTAAYATLNELIDRGAVTVKHGARLDRMLAKPGESVRLFDPVEGETGDGFDPIALELEHPRAMRTEPGDVVFTHTPRPAASVDVTGGSVVSSPARVLRLTGDAPVSPHALARTINRQPRHAREWRSWTVPALAPAEQSPLETALVELDHLRAELWRRLAAATDLADQLIDGVAAGAVTLTTENEPGD